MIDLIIKDLTYAQTIANESGASAIAALNVATDGHGVELESIRYLAARGIIEVVAERSTYDQHAAADAEALLITCIQFAAEEAPA